MNVVKNIIARALLSGGTIVVGPICDEIGVGPPEKHG
jgi:hypothetical protein